MSSFYCGRDVTEGHCTVLFVFLCREPHCNPSNAGVNAEKTSCEPQCCSWPGHGAHSDLELATTGHLVTLTPHRGLVTGISSQTSCGPASPGDLHTWATFIGLGFSCDNQGLAAVPGACLYLSVAVSQERGSGGRNCLVIRVEWACVPVQAGRPTHASHCSVVPVLSRGSLCDSLC